jgi:hypothetical protein
MFIEPLLTTFRAPAERNVSGDEWKIEHVSLLWSDEESFEDRAFYKHFVPTGRGSCVRRTLLERQEVTNLLTENLEDVQRSRFISLSTS